MEEDQPVIVGEVVKPHGVKGELVVEPLTDFPAERFKPGNVVETVASNEFSELTITGSRSHKQRLLVETKEVEDRDGAEKLRGVQLAVQPESVIYPGKDQYYGFQLLGLEAVGKNGGKIGVIREVAGGSPNHILVIEHPELGKIDYPAVDSLVHRVVLEEEKIVLDLPRGWRNLAREEREKP